MTDLGMKRKDKLLLSLLWLHLGLVTLSAYYYNEHMAHSWPMLLLVLGTTILYKFPHKAEWFRCAALLGFVFATAFFIHASGGRIEVGKKPSGTVFKIFLPKLEEPGYQVATTTSQNSKNLAKSALLSDTNHCIVNIE